MSQPLCRFVLWVVPRYYRVWNFVGGVFFNVTQVLARSSKDP